MTASLSASHLDPPAGCCPRSHLQPGLLRLLAWLSDILPAPYCSSPRHGLPVRVPNHTPRNSFLFSLSRTQCVSNGSVSHWASGCQTCGEGIVLGCRQQLVPHLAVTLECSVGAIINRPAATSCFSNHLSKKWKPHLLSLPNAGGVSERLFGLKSR